MSRKKRNIKLEKLKRERWSFYKASQYRSSWRGRCKKVKGDLDQVPTRKEIQDWLDSGIPYRCYITNDFLNKKTLQADHKYPISRGGSFKLKNIGLTTKRLNQIKGEMTVKELKQLLRMVAKWEDGGESLFRRLLAGTHIYNRRRR